MIVEMRSYDLNPGKLPLAEERFAAGLEYRTKLSPLGAFFHVEIGPLNRIIHLWPYDSLAHRDQVRKEYDHAHWPPKIAELAYQQESKILTPAPYSPPLEPAKLGEVYEIRTYTMRPGTLAGMIEEWGKSIEDRQKVSPLAFVGYTELGPLNQWIHIWPYADVNERNRLRAAAIATGKWPPNTAQFLLKQETCIAIPTAFSPLH